MSVSAVCSIPLFPRRVVDPDTVVTFSVRGCQPSKLPFDLPLCVAQQQVHSAPESSAPAVEVSPAAPSAAAPVATGDTKPTPADTKPASAEIKPASAENPPPVHSAESAPASTMAPIVAAEKPAEAAAPAAPADQQETPAASP